MYEKKLKQLGAYALVENQMNLEEALLDYERSLSVRLPKDYRSLLLKYTATLGFKKRVCYLPENKTPFDRPNGTLMLEALYGLERNDDNLVSMLNCYKDRMPQLVIPIGAAPGGNQICMDLSQSEKNPIYLWDHEAEREMIGQPENDYGNMVQIFSSLSAFIEALKVEEEEDIGDLGVIKSESWLDF